MKPSITVWFLHLKHHIVVFSGTPKTPLIPFKRQRFQFATN